MNANRNSNSKKSYCKVCHDAGKSESVYTSHCVKTYNVNTGKKDTACPTLLTLECRYCYKIGHTVKFCPVLEQNKKIDVERARDRAREQYHARQEQAPKQAVSRMPKNAFASLVDDSDDKHETQVPTQKVQMLLAPASIVDEFPALMGNTRVVQNNNTKSYSCIAATPADEKRLELSRQQRLRQTIQKKVVSWADEEDDSASEVEDESNAAEAVVSQAGASVYFQPSSYTYTNDEDDDW